MADEDSPKSQSVSAASNQWSPAGGINECRMMLSFLRESGMQVPAALTREIAMLDAMLATSKLPSVAELPPEMAKMTVAAAPSTTPGAAAAPQTTESEPGSATELVLKIHGALSALIAPATALTLRATEPATTGRTLFGRMPIVVRWSAIAAIVFGVLFVLTTGAIAARKVNSAAAPSASAAQPTPSASAGARAASSSSASAAPSASAAASSSVAPSSSASAAPSSTAAAVGKVPSPTGAVK